MTTLLMWLTVASVAVWNGQQCDQALTTREMRECLSRELQIVEERLGALEASVKDGLNERRVVLFQRASVAWSLYRDLQCESEAAEFEGGTLAPVTALACRVRLTRQRTETVESARGPNR